MPNRPSLSLALIAKNEAHNIPRLFESVKGCFDEIVFVDTGSTDGSIDVAREYASKIGTDIKIEHFKWINDFGAARNFSFDHCAGEFICWMDLDDALFNRENFIIWRDTAMGFADFWLAPYDYALKPDGSPVISFSRERVIRRGISKWKYFIHEGLTPAGMVQAIASWKIQHHRSEADCKADRSRNISIIESRLGDLDSRLLFYYGKELYENKQTEKALSVLTDAATKTDLEMHDRILAIQYSCYSAMAEAEKRTPEHQGEKINMAIQLAHQGLILDPCRAEFYHVMGECYLKMGQLQKALPMFSAAENCKIASVPPSAFSPIFTFEPLYGEIPKLQKAKIYFNMGDIDNAEKEARGCFEKFKSEEAAAIIKEVERIRPLISVSGNREPINDIVITTPPQTAYPFDEKIYETKGLGGSETALIHMAKWLKKYSGCNVKIFQMRDNDEVMPSGVEYLSNKNVNAYMSRYSPRVHIAWRHNIKLTNAPTYLWCHDLVTPTCDVVQNFDHMLCLSPFHRDYVRSIQGIPLDKIIVTRNGIDPEKFNFERPAKNPNKLVWMSSPDRGLDRAMLVADRLIKKFPAIELHVYYGIENLYKYGPQMSALADRLKKMMDERPYVKYHGFTEQNKMYRDVSDAVIWLHPCSFIESFCITALEMLTLGIYPVTRRLGALQNTLADAESKGMATLLDHDCVTDQEIEAYEKATENAINEQKYKRVALDPTTMSWENLAKDWIRFLGVE